MLVAIILFFILIGLFVVSIIFNNLQESSQDIKEDKTLSAIESLAGTAEFICPETKSNCVDADKLIGLLGRQSYNSFWSFSSLKVVRSSGFDKQENSWIKCSLENYPNCDIIDVYDKNVNENVISSFVALCRRDYENNAAYERCEIAKLLAGTEIK